MHPIRSISKVVAMGAALLVTACTSTLNPLSISESQLQSFIQDQVRQYDREQFRSGSPLSVKLRSARVKVGPDGRDVVGLQIDGEVSVNALLATIPVDVALEMEGTPYFDREEQAVYIRRLQLLDSRVESPLFKGDFAPITDKLMRVVGQMLERVPVYRLDPDSFSGTLIRASDLDIKVMEGRLVLVPAQESVSTASAS